MIERISAPVIPVRDVRTCALFYRDKLRFNLDQLEQDEAYLTVGEKDGLVLALRSVDPLSKEISEERMRPKEEENIKRGHCVAFVGDLPSEYDALRRRGVQFVDRPKTVAGGWRTAHFEDPEGTLWELSQRPKKKTQ